MKKALILAPVLVVGLLLAGCGGSNRGNGLIGQNNPRVRAANFFSDVNGVNATSDNANGNTNLLTGSTFGTVGAYNIVEDGTRTITFADSSNNLTLKSMAEDLHLNNFYTVIGTGTGVGGRQIILLSDSQTVAQNQTRIRFVNANETNTSVDFYVTPTSVGSLTGQTPQNPGVAYLDNTVSYASFTPGSFTVWVTPAGTPGTVLVKKNVTLSANTVITMVYVKTSGGQDLQTITDDPVTSP